MATFRASIRQKIAENHEEKNWAHHDRKRHQVQDEPIPSPAIAPGMACPANAEPGACAPAFSSERFGNLGVFIRGLSLFPRPEAKPPDRQTRPNSRLQQDGVSASDRKSKLELKSRCRTGS
jgi:hypothetical protein